MQLASRRRALCAQDMSEPRSIVITGASRGLGLASAAHMYNQGWRVVAAMRSPETGSRRCGRRPAPVWVIRD